MIDLNTDEHKQPAIEQLLDELVDSPNWNNDYELLKELWELLDDEARFKKYTSEHFSKTFLKMGITQRRISSEIRGTFRRLRANDELFPIIDQILQQLENDF